MKQQVALVAVTTTAATVVAVVALVKQYWKVQQDQQWGKCQRIMRKFARECATPVPKLWQVANAMASDMAASLSSSDEAKTSLNMVVSYVSPLLTGIDEKGMYYGLNMKQTTFSIVCGRLLGKNEPIIDLHVEDVSIPPNVMIGTSEELYDFIALEIAKFVSAHPENHDETPGSPESDKKLGFTLSCAEDKSTAISGSVITLKKFSADATGENEMVTGLNQALEKHGLNFRVHALVDDIVGNLAGGRYYDKDCVAAITLGKGSNAAYVDAAQLAPRWHNSLPKKGEIVISMEWGNFNSCHLPITQYDSSLDAASSNPGNRIFEKLISGVYLGEIVRRVLLWMAQDAALFGQSVPPKLLIPYLLRSPDMAAMHQDTSEDREVVHEKLMEVFGITNLTPMATEIVAEVCDIVTERGARLAAAGAVAIVKKLGRIDNRRSLIIMEGGLYDHYRIFRNYLHSGVWEMLGNELSDNIVIEHSRRVSGAGPLFLAASPDLDS
ncbi:putative hexokinase-like 2 protein [Hibiscus syriacus]|uniref:Phosphotransferase n=1 Tax=Hibiscus syriacus TaxID=106335 RepID=A0A6A2ZR94_HIBSY|nr:probable hexokinase-like 2 protein [Hibiscus syriacus]KAE8694056.1 putative hexokinase-like 2 protein [Hibiscus syriacus]